MTLLQTGIIFYIGLYSLMTKTFNLLNRQLLINLLCFGTVFVIVRIFPFSAEFVVLEYSVVSGVIILFELMVARMVLRYIINMK